MPKAFGPYPATVGEWHDGDTCRIVIDLGFGVALSSLRCRLYGVNAPELGTPEGYAARDFVRELCPPGTPVSTISFGWDKYGGRYDGSVRLADGRDIGAALLAAGHANPA